MTRPDMTEERPVATDPTDPTDPDAPAPAPVAAPADPADPFAGEQAADPADPLVAALLARTRTEYGRFTARTALTWNGTLAFTAGTAVPTHHQGVPDWLTDGVLDDATPGEPIDPERR